MSELVGGAVTFTIDTDSCGCIGEVCADLRNPDDRKALIDWLQAMGDQ